MTEALGKIGNKRWIICALLFFAATINYIDRQVIGLLKPALEKEFGWDERTYAAIVFSFQLAYAIGMVLSGRINDVCAELDRLAAQEAALQAGA